MAAIAAYLRNVLVVGISAVVATIFLITAYRAHAPFVSAPVVIIISHNASPEFVGFCMGRKKMNSSLESPDHSP